MLYDDVREEIVMQRIALSLKCDCGGEFSMVFESPEDVVRIEPAEQASA